MLRFFVPSRGNLHVVCFPSDRDIFGKNLHPRSELRLNRWFKNHRVVVSLQLSIPNTHNNFIFFQLMADYFPLIQLEIREGYFGVRYKDFSRNQLIRTPVIKADSSKHEWKIHAFVDSTHPDQGINYIIVYLDNKIVFYSTTVAIPRTPPRKHWIQLGVYRSVTPASQVHQAHFHRLEVENTLPLLQKAPANMDTSLRLP